MSSNNKRKRSRQQFDSESCDQQQIERNPPSKRIRSSSNQNETDTNKSKSNVRLNMNYKTILLIEGFIRLHQHDLNKWNNYVIKLFYAFYNIPFYRFINYRTTKTNPHNVYGWHFQISPFISINISNKQICTDNIIKIFDPEKKYSTNIGGASCYIPDISTSLPSPQTIWTKYKYYDGILVHDINDDNGQYSVACLILFSTNNRNGADYSEYKVFPSYGCSWNNSEPETFLYCGKKNGIIAAVSDYQSRGYRFNQLKLENISSQSYRFEDFAISNSNWRDGEIWSNKQPLNVKYITNIDKEIIFAMQKTSNNIKCRLCVFDDDSEWKSISDFVYKGYNNTDKFYCDICNGFDENDVYVVSDPITAKYNFIKNEWFILCDDIKKFDGDSKFENTAPKIWFDDADINILYSMWRNKESLEFRYFDIRDNKQKWNDIKCVEPYNNIIVEAWSNRGRFF